MNKRKITKDISRKLNRVGFKLKKHSPEILVVGGVIGVVTSGIMAFLGAFLAIMILKGM